MIVERNFGSYDQVKEILHSGMIERKTACMIEEMKAGGHSQGKES